jgi:hypothetical protein
MLSENVTVSLEIAETRWPGEQRKTSIQFAGNSVPYVAPCPLWVKSRHLRHKTACPLYPRKRTFAVQTPMSAKGQKRTSDLKNRIEPIEPNSR